MLCTFSVYLVHMNEMYISLYIMTHGKLKLMEWLETRSGSDSFLST